MASLKTAYDFIINKCNANNVRYSQAYREGEIIDGIQYYDCSSLMYAGLKEGGYYNNVSNYTPWFWTAIEEEELTKIGFQKLNAKTSEWKKGDILWRSGHTEMVYSSLPTKSMGARSSKLSAEDQVSIHNTTKESWTYIFRSPISSDDLNTTNLSWINKDDYLTDEEKQNNAEIVWTTMKNNGWNEYSISALLGNMDQESNINPGFSQRGGGTGYGLVQWTPGTRWKNWADLNGYAYNDGYGQLAKIQEEMTASNQDEWYKTSVIYGDNPPNGFYELTRDEFIHNRLNKSIEYLTSAWLWEYERPNLSDAMENYRIERALYWYDYFRSYEPGGFTLPVWLLFRLLNRKESAKRDTH